MAEASLFTFASRAYSEDTFNVLRFQGTEEISRPYRFEIELLSEKPDLDLQELLENPATLMIRREIHIEGERKGVQNLPVHGMLAEFEQGDTGPDGTYYRAVLVPRLWRLSLRRNTRIFQDRTVKEIIEEIFKDHGLTDFVFHLQRSLPKREYLVQYQESDLNFVSRLAEHEGIFYFFEQTEDGDKVVFGDSASAHPDVVGEGPYPYRPATSAGGGETEVECIRALRVRRNPIPQKVILKDYNYRRPDLDLTIEAKVSDRGIGEWYLYGEHYKDKAEGDALARIRAEEIAGRAFVLSGRGNCRSFRAGCRFELAEHPQDRFNGKFLLVRVNHKGDQAAAVIPSSGGDALEYHNEFEGIPADTPFRPARITPKPKIAGFMHAHVDAAGSGQYAELDDQGRYKVKIPYDLSGKKDGKASRYVRMAQPYSGADYGMHFPVHKNAEVVLYHLDGDPDRPVIGGCVPNPSTASPVKDANQTKCVIRTASNNKIEIEDAEGAEQIVLSTPKENTVFSLGAPQEGNVYLVTDGSRHVRIGTKSKEEIGGKREELVGGDAEERILGNDFREVGLNRQEKVGGDVKVDIAGNETRNVGGWDWSNYVGHKIDIFGGLQSSTFMGLKHDTVLGVTVEIGYSAKVEKVGGPKLFESPHQMQKIDGAWVTKVGGVTVIKGSGPVTLSSAARILLKCGGSKIELTPGGITISAPKVTVKASANATVSGQVTEVKGSGRLDLRGGMIINAANGVWKVRAGTGDVNAPPLKT